MNNETITLQVNGMEHKLTASPEVTLLDALRDELQVRRINSSDLLELAFKASDPGFAYDFLFILNESFIDRYQLIKRNEVGSVVAFFEDETEKAQSQLSWLWTGCGSSGPKTA